MKFKLTIITLLLLFTSSSIMTSCQNDNEVNQDNELTNSLKLFVNQFFDTSNLDIEVLKIENKLNTKSKLITSKSNSVEQGKLILFSQLNL